MPLGGSLLLVSKKRNFLLVFSPFGGGRDMGLHASLSKYIMHDICLGGYVCH